MKYIILIGVLLFSGAATGQPGHLDDSFGKHALVQTEFDSNYYNLLSKVALQPDGKILAAGSSSPNYSEYPEYFALARFGITGLIDSSFGNNGKITLGDSYSNIFQWNCSGLLLQSDGKIVITGTENYIVGSAPEFLAVRLNTDGTTDADFGWASQATTSIPHSLASTCTCSAIQPDGKIILAGNCESQSANSSFFAIVRYNTDGSPDLTFADKGISVTGDSSGWYFIESIALDNTGNIIAAGTYTTPTGSDYQFAIARFTPNGMPDSSFGFSGSVLSDELGIINSILIQPDGKIIALQELRDSGAHHVNYALTRYNVNGSKDVSFGVQGSIKLFGSYGTGLIKAIAFGPNGMMYATGSVVDAANNNLITIRCTSHGTIDSSYGNNGVSLSILHSMNVTGFSLFSQPDTRVVVGTLLEPNDNSVVSYSFGLQRFNPDGSLDGSFSSHPAIVTSNSPGDDEATCISVSSDDRILLGGYSDIFSNNSEVAALRYFPEGIIDSTFWTSGNGKMFLINDLSNLTVNTCLNLSSTVMYFSGNLYDPVKFNVKFGLIQYRSTTGFIFTSSSTDFGQGSNYCQSLLEQPDEKLIASGFAFNGRNYDFALARYFKDLVLDQTFGTNGMVTTDLQSNQDYAYASALQTDGKIILAGTSYNDKQWQIALVRYNSDGSLDQSFGNSGIVLTAIHDSNDCAKAVQVQDDGEIVVAGYTLENAHGLYHPILLRYNSNGSLDSSFGKNGIVETSIGTGDAKANGMVIQSDGRIVIAGYASNGKDDDFMVACYNSNGSLDNNFGNHGITTTDYGFGDDHANALALQSDGSIVVAGYAFNGTDKDYAVARYIPDLSLGVIDRKSSQNIPVIYPNPISNSAKLEYELSEGQPVTIKLFDLLGNLRETFISSEMRSEGKNSETLNLSNSIPVGSYYIVVETKDVKTSVKVVKE